MAKYSTNKSLKDQNLEICKHCDTFGNLTPQKPVCTICDGDGVVPTTKEKEPETQ